VDDDKALCGMLAEQFAMSEFATAEAGSIGEADAQLQSRFDAIILDVGLPDGDGRDYCAELRCRGVKVPIIMLTGWDDESDVVRGLNAGANDYIAKPSRSAELLARARAAAHFREQRRRSVHHRTIHLLPLRQAAAGRDEQ
jgi:DNA-binding response OmpR family regulator